MAMLVFFLLVALPAAGPQWHWDDLADEFNLDVYYIQIDRTEMHAIEQELGFKLGHPSGKIFLTPDERKKLLDALRNAESAEVIGQGANRAMAGMCEMTQHVEEIRYPIEFVIGDNGTISAVGETFETRELGFLCTLHADEYKPGLVFILAFTEVSRLMGWHRYHEGISLPVIKSWNHSFRIIVPNGMTYVAVQIPPSDFNTSTVLPANDENLPRKTKYCLFLLGVQKAEN